METLQTNIEVVERPTAKSITESAPVFAPVIVNSEWCKRCDICSAMCPRCVLEPDRDGMPIVARPRECTQCGMCWTHCPDLAIRSTCR